jgi:hypothetical protein
MFWLPLIGILLIYACLQGRRRRMQEKASDYWYEKEKQRRLRDGDKSDHY